jgi:uncharacterized membrane protein
MNLSIQKPAPRKFVEFLLGGLNIAIFIVTLFSIPGAIIFSTFCSDNPNVPTLRLFKCAAIIDILPLLPVFLISIGFLFYARRHHKKILARISGAILALTGIVAILLSVFIGLQINRLHQY